LTDEKSWTFHSPHKNEIVYDPELKAEIAVFKEHQFKTQDPKLAKKLQERNYEEWVVFGSDDMIRLDSGEEIRLGDLPKQIAAEFIGKPKRAAQDLISKILAPLRNKDSDDSDSKSEDPSPAQENQCPICGKVFPSQSALNGHFAHCKKSAPEE